MVREHYRRVAGSLTFGKGSGSGSRAPSWVPRSGAVSQLRLPFSTKGCVAVAAVVKVSWRPANLRHGCKGLRDVWSRLGLS